MDISSVLPHGQDEGSAMPHGQADTQEPATHDAETELSDQLTAAEDALADGEGATLPEAGSEQQAQIDWEAEDNPYKQRLKGLQSSIQREVETRRALEHRLMQLEEQQQQAAMVERERALEQAARQTVIRDIAQKYGVPRESLDRFNDPDSMEYHAQAIAAERRKRQQAARQAAGSDRFEGESPGRRRTEQKPKTFAEARQRFIEEAGRWAAQ